MSKPKEASANDVVQQYLREQNRPYSAVDIFNNTHKKFGKTAVQKALDQLVEDGDVVEKAYGKQKVYVVNQKSMGVLSDKELNKMDDKINDLTQRLKAAQDALRDKESECNTLLSSLTTKEAEDKLKAAKAEIGRLKGKLKKLESSGGNCVDPEEKKRVTKAFEDGRKEWRKRKRIAMDVVNTILESYPKKKKELLEEVGVETDEDVGVVMPP